MSIPFYPSHLTRSGFSRTPFATIDLPLLFVVPTHRHHFFYTSNMYASIIFYALVALYGVMASPAQGPEVEPRAIEPRMPSFGDIPFPNFPVRNPQSNNMGGGSTF